MPAKAARVFHSTLLTGISRLGFTCARKKPRGRLKMHLQNFGAGGKSQKRPTLCMGGQIHTKRSSYERYFKTPPNGQGRICLRHAHCRHGLSSVPNVIHSCRSWRARAVCYPDSSLWLDCRCGLYTDWHNTLRDNFQTRFANGEDYRRYRRAPHCVAFEKLRHRVMDLHAQLSYS